MPVTLKYNILYFTTLTLTTFALFIIVGGLAMSRLYLVNHLKNATVSILHNTKCKNKNNFHTHMHI